MTLNGFLRGTEANWGRKGGLEESDPQFKGENLPQNKNFAVIY